MGLLLNLLGAPLMGPLKLTQWVAEKIKEVADQEMGDEDKLKAELIELQMKLEMEKDMIPEEEFKRHEDEYKKREKEITDALNSLKKNK